MPATEKTWRNMHVLHVTFCVVAVMLLVATVFMLSADHNRPWKKYQRKFRELETWSAAAQVDSENSLAFRDKTIELEASLAEVRRADLDSVLLGKFFVEAEVVKEDKKLEVSGL